MGHQYGKSRRRGCDSERSAHPKGPSASWSRRSRRSGCPVEHRPPVGPCTRAGVTGYASRHAISQRPRLDPSPCRVLVGTCRCHDCEPHARRAADDAVRHPGRDPRQGRSRGPVRDVASPRGPVRPGRTHDRSAGRCRACARRSAGARPVLRHRRRAGRREHAVLRLAPRTLCRRPRNARHRPRRSTRHGRLECPDPSRGARYVRPDGRRGRRPPLDLDERRAGRTRCRPAHVHEHGRRRRPRRCPRGSRLRQDRPVRDVVRRDVGAVLPASARRSRPSRGAGRRDTPRRAGAGTDGGQQPGRARPRPRTV